MTFPQAGNPVPGTPDTTVNNFYVIAPQTGTPQGTAPFPHDHVVGVSPARNHGTFSVSLLAAAGIRVRRLARVLLEPEQVRANWRATGRSLPL